MPKASELFDLTDPLVSHLFRGTDAVWQVLPRLPELVDGLLKGRRVIKGEVAPSAHIAEGAMHIGAGAVVEPGATILGATYIGEGVHVRSGAYIRSDCIFLAGSLIGHSTEAKGALMLPRSKAPHFAYVGDSVLGANVNLGAGTKLSNVPVSRRSPTIVINVDGEQVDTGLRKFGAILGDDVQTGCNSVLNPGTVVGRGSLIYPNVSLRPGVYGAATIFKLRQEIEVATREP